MSVAVAVSIEVLVTNLLLEEVVVLESVAGGSIVADPSMVALTGSTVSKLADIGSIVADESMETPIGSIVAEPEAEPAIETLVVAAAAAPGAMTLLIVEFEYTNELGTILSTELEAANVVDIRNSIVDNCMV